MTGGGSNFEWRVKVLENRVRALKASSLAVMVMFPALLSIGWMSSTPVEDLVVATIALKVPAEGGDIGLSVAQGALSMGLTADGSSSLGLFDVIGAERASLTAKADGKGDYSGSMVVLDDQNSTRIKVGLSQGPCATEMIDEKGETWLRIGEAAHQENPGLLIEHRAVASLPRDGSRFFRGAPPGASGTGTRSVLLGWFTKPTLWDVHGLLIIDENGREILSASASGCGQSAPRLRLRCGPRRNGFETGISPRGANAHLLMEGGDKKARASILVFRWNVVNFRIHNRDDPPYEYGVQLNTPTWSDLLDALKSDIFSLIPRKRSH